MQQFKNDRNFWVCIGGKIGVTATRTPTAVGPPYTAIKCQLGGPFLSGVISNQASYILLKADLLMVIKTEASGSGFNFR